MSSATLSERVHAPVSDGELERRWAALRSSLEDAGLEALVLHTVAGAPRQTMPRVFGFVGEQLRRHLDGDPLVNVVKGERCA